MYRFAICRALYFVPIPACIQGSILAAWSGPLTPFGREICAGCTSTAESGSGGFWTTDLRVMVSFALFKLFLLPVLFVVHTYTTTPPNAAPGPKDRIYNWQIFDKVTRNIGKSSQAFVLFSLACEFLLAASILFPNVVIFDDRRIANAICPHPKGDPAVGRVSPLYALSLLIVFAGSIGRAWCYNALGKLFTVEVTLRPSHTLVTHGLYSWVRHPAYTSLFTHLVGMIVLHMAPGGWNYECGIMQSGYAWFVRGWVLVIVYTIISLSRRVNVEDSLLKGEFGSKWERYQSAVPYKFVPGIF